MRDTDPPISQALIETIERDHLVQTKLEPADLLFVFGTRHGVDEFIATAADLWRRGYFKWALVSGGPTAGEPRTEADILAAGMIAAGVPADVILTESAATNTGENVILSLPILEDRIGLANIRSVIALGKLHTSVRYLMTLQRHWPQVDKMLVTVNTHAHPPAEWHRRPDMREKTLSEWRKLEPYKAAGFIADWPGAG